MPAGIVRKIHRDRTRSLEDRERFVERPMLGRHWTRDTRTSTKCVWRTFVLFGSV